MLKQMIKLIREAKVNYIMKHKKTGKIFYPVIADLLIFDLLELDHLEKEKDFITALASIFYSIKNNSSYYKELPEDKKRHIEFKKHLIDKMNIKHYVASLFSKELKIEYDYIRRLINYLFYWNTKDARTPKTPLNNLPQPPINPFRYSNSLDFIIDTATNF